MKENKLAEKLAGTAYELIENHAAWLHVKCAVCGRESVLDDARVRRIAGMSGCQCHKFGPKSFEVARFQQLPEYILCIRRNKFRKLLIDSGYAQDAATPSDAIAQLGARPASSEAFQYGLTITSSPSDNPRPQFGWRKVLRGAVIDSVMSKSRLKGRSHLAIRLHSLEAEEVLKSSKTGLVRYREKVYPYETFHGKTIRGVTITNVFASDFKTTKVYYISYRCTRCGFQGTMTAYNALYKDRLCCQNCGKSASYRMHYNRNSAVARSNPFNRLSQQSSHELATAAFALQLGAREYVSQYSIDASDFEKVYERCELDMYWGWS